MTPLARERCWRSRINEDSHYSKAEVIVRDKSSPILPKQESWSFDKNNSRRDTLTVFNFNAKMQTGRSGEGKCVGSMQTIMENFSNSGDVVLDLTAHKGESFYAAANCGRVLIGLTDDQESCEEVIDRLMARENNSPPNVVVEKELPNLPQVSSSKQPLDEEDDLGDILGSEQ